MEIAIFIIIVLEIIILIYFFGLCSDIKRIKNKIAPNEDVWSKVLFLLSIGEQQKARDLYIKSIINSDVFVNDYKSVHEKMESVKKIYGEGLKYLGYTLPNQ